MHMGFPGCSPNLKRYSRLASTLKSTMFPPKTMRPLGTSKQVRLLTNTISGLAERSLVLSR